MTLPHQWEPLSTPSLRPHTSLHRTPTSTESNTSSKTTLSNNSFPSLKIYSAYERHFIHSLLYYIRELDALTSQLPASFTISPTFGPLVLSINRKDKNTIITYNLDPNRPAK
mmetsp:Transcript_47462/g.57475  ORF Transcript_47462/g.57475 Transcript_47462/m.57475 type:complete len:112 (-) Transcript_47462:214-549(-)